MEVLLLSIKTLDLAKEHFVFKLLFIKLFFQIYLLLFNAKLALKNENLLKVIFSVMLYFMYRQYSEK